MSALAGFHVDPLSWSNWNLDMLVFVEEENRRTRRKTCRANSTHIWHWAGIKPRPRWWEERAVTTASSILDVLILSVMSPVISITLPQKHTSLLWELLELLNIKTSKVAYS